MDRLLAQKSKTESSEQTEWKLDTGYLFKNLEINVPAGGAAIGDFELIEYEVNGTVVWSLSGEELDEINKRDGLPAFDGTSLLIPFGLESMKDQRMRELTYINTGIASPKTGKIIAAHVLRITWAVARVAQVWAVVSEKTKDGPGLIRRFQRGSMNGAIGETEWTGAQKGKPQFAFWRRLFVKPGAGTVDFLKIYTTNQTIWGPKVPKAVADTLAKLGGHIAGAFFGYVAEFSMIGGGYTALARTDEDGKTIMADTADVPFFNTAGVKDDTVTVEPTNSANTNNGFLLEVLGEID